MRRGFNKKAQEGMSMNSLGAVILVVIAIIVLVLILTGVANPILEGIGLIPGSGLAGIVTACESYVPLSSTADYCTFREVTVDGREQYINCEDSRVQSTMDSERKNILSCKDDGDKLVIAECALLVKQSKSKPAVNGKECIQYDFTCGGSGADGTLNGIDPETLTDKKCASGYKLIENFNSETQGEKCCVIV